MWRVSRFGRDDIVRTVPAVTTKEPLNTKNSLSKSKTLTLQLRSAEVDQTISGLTSPKLWEIYLIDNANFASGKNALT